MKSKDNNDNVAPRATVVTPVRQPGDEPSVALYIDDAYVPAESASLENFSRIDFMEVGKDPQGTLFGRDATGGVIQVHTKDPSIKRHLETHAALVAMLAAFILVTGRVNAQSSQGPTAMAAGASTSTEDQLAEITVTANRREENQQQVPIAVTAITADTAGKVGIVNALGLGEAVPGAVFNRQANGTIPFIRGVGNPNQTPGDEPSVASYVDDVYIPLSSSGISNYNTITRIEVEKGPQGTLFGRNATGGVVQVFTKNPSNIPEFQATESYANYDTPSGSLYASGPLVSDVLSANVAVYGSRQYHGWGHNLTTNEATINDEYDFGGRVKLLFTPNDRMSFLLAVDTDTTGTGVGVTFSATPGSKTTNLSILGIPIPGASAPSPTNFYDTYGNAKNYSTNYQSGVSLKANIDLGWANLVNIAAYRHNNAQQYFDFDDGPASIENTYFHSIENTVTEELRLQSEDSSAIKWVGGFYMFDDKAGVLPIRLDALAPPFAAIYPGGVVPDFVASFGKEYTHSYAAFGQVTDEILPRTFMTLGLRYTEDNRTGSSFNTSALQQALVTPNTNVLPTCPITGNTFVAPIPICVGGTGAATFKSPSGKFDIRYQFTDDLMGYVAYNRGFKSGVFNLVSILSPQDPPVKPEHIDAYTFGEKAEFLDHRLRINTEAYWYKFKDIQEQIIVQDTSHAVNAARATMKGAELEVTALPVPHLTVTGSVSVESAYFTDYPNGAFFVYNQVNGGNCALGATNTCGVVPRGTGAPPGLTGNGTAASPYSWNLSGNHLPNAPPYAFSISAQYDMPTSSGKWDYNIALNHIGGYYFEPDNGQGQIAPSSPSNDKQPLTNLVNASAGWTSLDGTLAIRLWGMNLAQKHYYSFNDTEANATQYSAAPPRTYGITFIQHFGGAKASM
jgi:iron complex outermembrane receptor protein